MKKLKKTNPTLYQIHSFIVKAKDLGYGSIEFEVSTHDYVSKLVTMKAVKPSKKSSAKSITKRIMIDDKKKK